MSGSLALADGKSLPSWQVPGQNPRLSPPGMGQPEGPFPVPPLSCVWGQMLWHSWPAEDIKSALSSHPSISVCESAGGVPFPSLKYLECPMISRAARLETTVEGETLNKPLPRPGHKNCHIPHVPPKQITDGLNLLKGHQQTWLKWGHSSI